MVRDRRKVENLQQSRTHLRKENTLLREALAGLVVADEDDSLPYVSASFGTRMRCDRLVDWHL